jgi:hypothetical protein
MMLYNKFILKKPVFILGVKKIFFMKNFVNFFFCKFWEIFPEFFTNLYLRRLKGGVRA